MISKCLKQQFSRNNMYISGVERERLRLWREKEVKVEEEMGIKGWNKKKKKNF